MLNVVIPGAGLVIVRREWLGLALALLFGVFAQIAIFGWWIVPEDIPRLLQVVAAAGVGGTWLGAQALLVQRLRLVTSPQIAEEMQTLVERARWAIDNGDWHEARQSLLVSRSLNDEHVEAAMLWAELMAKTGRRREARRWQRRIARLDAGTGQGQAAESREALR